MQGNDGLQTDIKVFYKLKSAARKWDCHYMPEKLAVRQVWASTCDPTGGAMQGGDRKDAGAKKG